MSLSVRLEEIVPLGPQVRAFRFGAVDGTLPAFSAGSSFRLSLPVGGGRANAYSLTSYDAPSGTYTIAVRKENPERSKGGSIYLHEEARVGQVFAAALPENHFSPSRTARHHVMLAAGIGITPFLSYLPELDRWGASYELHYSYRGAGGGAFQDLLGRHERIVLHDSSAGGRMNPATILDRQAVGAHVYLCGPHAFIQAVRAHATETGWPPSHVHFEQFTPSESPPGRAFDVRLARSGAMVCVGAGDTLLEALEKQGVNVPYSCRVGGCGTCKVGVIRGSIDHRDVCLTPEEREEGRTMLACISRSANGELTLDL